MKVIIPAAGIGKRLRPHTHVIPKAMLQVAGRPIIGHIIDRVIRDLKFDEIVIIVGYKKEILTAWVKEAYPGIPLRFVEQKEMLGLGHAVLKARSSDEEARDLFIILGDTIVDMDVPAMVKQGCSSLGVRHVEDPRRFGVVELKGEMISSLVEKPEIPPSNLALMGVYYIREGEALFDALQYLVDENIKTKNEYQITDALNHMLQQGVKMKPFHVDNWFDCGTLETLLATNRFLLEQRPCQRKQKYPDTVFVEPVFVGEGSVIRGAVLGPYVSVGCNVTIQNAVIRDAIIYDEAYVENVAAQQSIIGTKSCLKGELSRYNTGPDTQIGS
ncbi:MAG TPA: nucleotidyl transferase [Firmicutes bacterium]|nr:nucleotidyl transferase [Bacillota bacterium]